MHSLPRAGRGHLETEALGMTTSTGEVCEGGQQVEREICSSNSRLNRALTALQSMEVLMERTEMRMTAMLRRIDSAEVEINEMRQQRNLACEIVTDLEGDVQYDKIRASVLASPRRASSLSRSRGTRHERKVSLENLQRVLSDRGVELEDDFMSSVANFGRKTVMSPTPSSWMSSRQKLEYHHITGGVGVISTSRLSAFLAK